MRSARGYFNKVETNVIEFVLAVQAGKPMAVNVETL